MRVYWRLWVMRDHRDFSIIDDAEKGKVNGVSQRKGLEAQFSEKKVIVDGSDVVTCPGFAPARMVEGCFFSKLPVAEVKVVKVASVNSHLLAAVFVFVFVALRLHSMVVIQLVLSLLSTMYPLWHRRATRKNRPLQRSGFDSLAINPLAIVLVKEDHTNMAVEEGMFVPYVELEGATEEREFVPDTDEKVEMMLLLMTLMMMGWLWLKWVLLSLLM
ncbi:hypothetical protein AMTR_s00168p00072090 [Amborella trichopoda]|uniref:Uncharacterized protein n=1 Tax=Amborella trichopoda TaxID=13333 RepID=W1PQ63_AMBTC|nr:hypothetical protein AMTR_s00168p00072090 [Amborella trichopoda]